MLPTHQLLRVNFTADVSDFVAGELRKEIVHADLFEESPVVYVAGHERRARDVRRAVQASFPEGTPERVARDLLLRYSPEIRLCSDVDRDFEFFACLHGALTEIGSTRVASRALVDALLEAWRRLAAGLEPSRRGAPALGKLLAPLGDRGRLLQAVSVRYQASLARTGRVDFDDVLWKCAELLPRWSSLGFAPRLVLVDELDAASPARLAFLKALLAAGSRGLVILRGSAEELPFLRPTHEALQGIVLQDFGGNARAPIECTEFPRAAFVRAFLCGDNGVIPQSVELRRPAGRAAEVRDVAREIKRLAQSGMSLDEVAVALPRAENYRGIISETFDAAGISFDSPLETPLAQTAPVAALLDLIRAARGGFERAELLDALATPLLPFALSHAETNRSQRLARLEQATRKAGIVGGKRLEHDWLEPLRTSGAHDRLEKGDLGFLETLWSLLRPFAVQEQKPVQFFEAVNALVRDSGMRAVLKDDARRGLDGAAASLIALHEFGALVGQLRSGFDAVALASMPTVDLSRALYEQASTRTLRPPESAGSRVRVLGLKELRGARFSHVFVLGLTDEDLPLGESESMFFSRPMEEQLADLTNAAAARELCRPVETSSQADYLYAGALLSGSARLLLSLPKALGEKTGVSAAPHARLLSGAKIELSDLRGDAHDSPISQHSLASAAGIALGEVECGVKAGAKLLVSGSLAAGLRGRAIELSREDLTSIPGVFEGALEPGKLALRFGPGAPEKSRHTFSPSQIDTYSDCPMRFWMRYVMQIKPPEEPTRDTPPTAVGSLVHRVFELFVHHLRCALGQSTVLDNPLDRAPVRVLDLAPDPVEARALALPLMRAALESARRELKPHGPFWAGTLAALAAGLDGPTVMGQGLLARFIDYEIERNRRGLGIRFVELKIGTGERKSELEPDVYVGAVDLPLGEGFVRLQGSVDRVDQGERGLEIIDYKTGSAKSMSEIRDGAAFQLPIYLAAVSAKTGCAPWGMAYLKTPLLGVIDVVDVTQARGKPAYDVSALVTQALPRRLGGILGALSKGVFVHLPARPPGGSHSPCNYCEFSTACARREDVIVARQDRVNTDPASLVGAYRPDTPPARQEDVAAGGLA